LQAAYKVILDRLDQFMGDCAKENVQIGTLRQPAFQLVRQLDYYIRHCMNELRLTQEEARDAMKMVRVIQDEYLGGRNDGTVIACPIWISVYLHNRVLFDELAGREQPPPMTEALRTTRYQRVTFLTTERIAKVCELVVELIVRRLLESMRKCWKRHIKL